MKKEKCRFLNVMQFEKQETRNRVPAFLQTTLMMTRSLWSDVQRPSFANTRNDDIFPTLRLKKAKRHMRGNNAR